MTRRKQNLRKTRINSEGRKMSLSDQKKRELQALAASFSEALVALAEKTREDRRMASSAKA
jgi:hypothetical protein